MSHLYVETAGREDTDIALLFMHGHGLDHTCFRPHVDALAGDYLLVFYDHRLNGRSPRVTSTPVDLRVMAEDAATIASESARKATVVVAHSFGAWVAVQAAIQSRSFVSGLVLVCPALSLTTGQTLLNHIATRGTSELAQLVGDALLGKVTTDAQFRLGWEALLPLYFFDNDTRARTQLLESTQFSAVGFNTFLAAGFGSLDWRAALASLRIPVLVIAGADDWLEQDPDGSVTVAAAVPRSERTVLERSGHFPFIERSTAFNNIVHTWIGTHQRAIISSHTAQRP